MQRSGRDNNGPTWTVKAEKKEKRRLNQIKS